MGPRREASEINVKYNVFCNLPLRFRVFACNLFRPITTGICFRKFPRCVDTSRPVVKTRGRHRAGHPTRVFQRPPFSLKTLQITVFSCDRSRGFHFLVAVAAPCHQKPHAVWLLGARPSENIKNTAPGGRREPNF